MIKGLCSACKEHLPINFPPKLSELPHEHDRVYHEVSIILVLLILCKNVSISVETSPCQIDIFLAKSISVFPNCQQIMYTNKFHIVFLSEKPTFFWSLIKISLMNSG